MIERFRRNFWLIASASIFLFLSLILVGINVANFALVAQEADNQTANLAAGHGRFDFGTFGPEGQPAPQGQPPSTQENSAASQENPGGFPFQPGQGPEFEMRASLRYFTVAFDAQGNGTVVALELLEVTADEAGAIEWAATLRNGSSVGWTRGNYRYRVYIDNGSQMVTVVDLTRELIPTRNVLYASLVGSLIGLLITMVALIPISKVLVKPLETSAHKQRRFVSDASHELKTPLTVISASAELLEMQYGRTEEIVTIQKQIRRLTEMVKNLNALAKMDEVEKVVKAPVDLSLCCEDVIVSFEPAFKAKALRFAPSVEAGISYQGDAASLSQLVSLLLDNGLKYASTYVEFCLRKEGGRIVIESSNDCENLPEGSLDTFFERFYRADESRASSTEGSGIGLSLAKEIVRSHGGRISAKSEKGVFHIKAEL